MKTIKQFGIMFVLVLSLASCTKEAEVKNNSSSGGGETTPFGEVCACAVNTPIGSTCLGTDSSTVCNGTLPNGADCSCAASTPIGQTCGNGIGGTCAGTLDTGNTNPGGGNCSGTTADGTGAGTPIHHFQMMLAGHQSWLPGTYSDPLASSTMPTVQEAMLLFRSDNRLKVRVKVNSQPYPTAGEEYCYGRETGGASDPFNYTKLRFRLHLRDIMCDNIDSGNPNNCLSGWYLGPRYRTQYIDPTNVDNCSNQIDIGAIRNQTPYGTTIEIEDVKSDSTCQYNGTFCPAEKIVRTQSCWHMTLQIVTDYTQDFI